MDYSFTDRARFSTKYGLVKRGYTIDTWDFQIDDATTPPVFPRWGTLLVDPDRSKFGVMFGDDTGYAAACGYLAEMLERAGRPPDAARFRERERDVRARLDRVSWQGTHFRHWVPEDETVVRDVGVDEREADLALEHVLAQPRHLPRAGGGDRAHVPEAPRRRCRPAPRASGTRSTRRSRRASATTRRRGST